MSPTVLEEPAPAFSLAHAEDVARKSFGLRASARPLASERDQNFALRDEDGGDTTEMISKKELRSFQDRVNIKEVPGGLTVFSFSGTPGDLRIEDDKDGVFFIFHGSSPPCLGGPSRNHDEAASLFDIEDVDDVAAER